MRGLGRRSGWQSPSNIFVFQGGRGLSVLTWGQNSEGQCGVRGAEVLLVPAPLESLEDHAVQSLALGRLHSSAVTANGEAWTWGCGKAGKLGLGTSRRMDTPARVEALVGNADVTATALGCDHTLFLDRQGAVWSCGENKEGQCGMGTSLEVLAAQRRAEFAMGSSWGWGGAHASSTGAQTQGSQRSTSHVSMAAHGLLKPFVQPWHRQQQVDDTRRLWDSAEAERRESGREAGTPSQFRGPGTGSFNWMAGAGGLGRAVPGHLQLPMRLGRDLHPLLASRPGPPDLGLEGRVVTSIAASKYFSALLTQDGRVWTFGGGFNGELGHSSSWQTQARPIEGFAAEAVEENGGAVRVDAGHTFCMCLTASGKVVMWGKVPGVPRHHPQPPAVEVEGLPPIVHIAAGHSHALLSDGERVWALGKWLSARGDGPVGPATGEQREVKALRSAGVASLAAGFHSSAIVSGDGRLYMWGHLMSKDSAWKLWKANTAHGRANSLPQRQTFERQWRHSYLGSDRPTLVPGVSGVKCAAVGAMHAAVVVDS